MEKPVSIIVAEAGSHYASSRPHKRVENAKYLADQAALCGADYVKYQMYLDAGKGHFAPMEGDDKRRVHWSFCDMSFAEWHEVRDHCKSLGIGFMASPFQKKAVEWVVALEPDYIKVASRCVREFPYDMVHGFKLIASDGMYPLPHHFEGFKLQCVSKYPTPLEEARWVRHDGLSDHSGSPFPAIDAIARGAKIVEVHFWVNPWDRDRKSALHRRQLSLVCEARGAFARMQKGSA